MTLSDMQAMANIHGDTATARAVHDDMKARRALVNLREWPGLGQCGECGDCGSTLLVLDRDVDDELDEAA